MGCQTHFWVAHKPGNGCGEPKHQGEEVAAALPRDRSVFFVAYVNQHFITLYTSLGNLSLLIHKLHFLIITLIITVFSCLKRHAQK